MSVDIRQDTVYVEGRKMWLEV